MLAWLRSTPLRARVAALAFLTLAACAGHADESAESSAGELSAVKGSRFVDIDEKLHEAPLTTLPTHAGLDPWSVAQNFLGSEERPTHGLSIRSRRILVDTADETPQPEAKWLHPRGTCASGRWRIHTDNPATGLFSIGTDVPAIVRVSSGDKVSEGGEQAGGRILGIAVKLFPATSPNQAVRTQNIIMLDQYGFERSTREHTWVENDGAPVYFTNVAPARSALGQFLSQFFDRFDQPNFARPVYGVARASIGGGQLIESRTPYEIRLRARPGVAGAAPLDFRSELGAQASTKLDIIIQSFDGTTPYASVIGELDLGAFVVSDYCDRRLRFHHSSIEDQLEKYSNYEVVQDLIDAQER